MRIKRPYDPTRYYIKKEDLEAAVLSYQKLYRKNVTEKLPIPQQPNTIGRYVLELCYRLGTKSNFSQYTYNDQMVGEAIEHCTKAVMTYNPTKTDNVFNYFTTVAWRAFQRCIIDERKQCAIKHKNYQHTVRITELTGHSQILTDASNNEHSNRVIEEYEYKHLSKKPLTTSRKANKVKDIKEKKIVQSKKNSSDTAHRPRPRKGTLERKRQSGHSR